MEKENLSGYADRYIGVSWNYFGGLKRREPAEQIQVPYIVYFVELVYNWFKTGQEGGSDFE